MLAEPNNKKARARNDLRKRLSTWCPPPNSLQ
jgi:hypothetical protein